MESSSIGSRASIVDRTSKSSIILQEMIYLLDSTYLERWQFEWSVDVISGIVVSYLIFTLSYLFLGGVY